jgi:hypothetical protein
MPAKWKMGTETKRQPQPGEPRSVEQRITEARDSLPGQRNGLPAGSLPGPFEEPQGDESRDPPTGAPTPPGKADWPTPQRTAKEREDGIRHDDN